MRTGAHRPADHGAAGHRPADRGTADRGTAGRSRAAVGRVVRQLLVVGVLGALLATGYLFLAGQVTTHHRRLVFARVADMPTTGRTAVRLPTWIPADATDIRVDVDAVGRVQALDYLAATAPTPRVCRAGRPPVAAPDGAPGHARDGRRQRCGGWFVVRRDLRTHAWPVPTPESARRPHSGPPHGQAPGGHRGRLTALLALRSHLQR